jgi:trehalose 6-phosphate synthase
VGATAYPISVDVDKVEVLSREPQTELHKNQILSQIGDRKLILRTDRIEPSKNILRGLQAYRAMLEDHQEHHGKVQMVMLLVPSRLEVDEYESYLREIMAEAGMINANYSSATWQPVSVILGDNYLRALAAMQIYDVLLINPIADGMNLVAKEGVLINTRDGVLVLSEQAGAIYELGEHAIDISPFDVYSTAEALHNALTMPRDEREEHAEALRKIVKKADVREWFANQLSDALAALKSQPKKSSTPSTPSTKKSEDSKTKAGVSSDVTPIAKE